MLFVFDKSKILFDEVAERTNRVAKAKIIAIAMVDTPSDPTSYYATLARKTISHFLLDANSVIKYNYSSTNVFSPATKWTSKSEKIVEKVTFVNTISDQQLSDFNSTVQITQDFIPLDAPNRPKTKLEVTGITIHSTGNESSYARNERAYLENPDRDQLDVAWHLCVDEKTCIQAVPFDEICYHAQQGSLSTIGIEMCHTGDRATVIRRTAKLTADLMKKYNLNISQIKRHYDWYEGKPCPIILQANNWEGWHNFLKMVENYYTDASNDANLDSDEDNGSTRLEKETTDVSFKEEDKNNPGDHIILFTVLNNQIDYSSIEKNLVKMIGDYLIYHKLDTSSVWRISDLVHSFSGDPVYYNAISDWNKLIASIKSYMDAVNNGHNNVEIIPTGVPHRDSEGNVIILPFEEDTRDITKTTYFMNTSNEAIDEEYDSTTINGQILYASKFEDGLGIKTGKNSLSINMYEPIYPDLSTPPRSATSLYNNGIMSASDIIKNVREDLVNISILVESSDKEETTENQDSASENVPAGDVAEDDILDKKTTHNTNTKPVIGKIPNFFDPYPTDNKIIELEKHYPIVTMEYEDASTISANQLIFMINRFGNVEQRLVRLENVLSTNMRYLQRMAARVEINCVYYGGQSMTNKYACIRCLADDLVNDAAIVTMDQCLNCSRYEPVIGQQYDIVDESLKPGQAQIFDDIQASYITKEEFVKNNQIQDHTEFPDVPTQDLTALLDRDEEDKDYNELLRNANNFAMNWTYTRFHEQSPHVIDYKYNPDEVTSNAHERLQDIYEDGWRQQSIIRVEKPDYGINSIAAGSLGDVNYNFSDNNQQTDYHTMGEYDVAGDDKRVLILSYAKKLIEYAQSEMVLYYYGAKILEKYMNKTPDELIELVRSGTNVNAFVDKKPEHIGKVIYFDCSGYTSYVYRLAGATDHSFTGRNFPGDKDFEVIVTAAQQPNLLEAVKQAVPGDLICYDGHIAIYSGLDEIYHASTDSNPKNKQVLVGKIKNSTNFKNITRCKALSAPSLKNMNYIPINMTLEDFIQVQKGKNVGRDTDGDGKVDVVQDGDYQYDAVLLKNYIDPSFRLNNSLVLQFADIRNSLPDGVVTAKVLDEYLQASGVTKKIQGIKVDSNYDPVRDKDGKLVWEEKYQFPRGEIWMAAAKKSGLNPLFLMIHCMGETGKCATSKWTNYSGIYKSIDGKNYLFNAYGIWCNDGDTNRIKARKNTELYKWFSLEKAVVEGATWIGQEYLGTEALSKHGRQDTAYFMKWHFGTLIEGQNGSPVTHQYATDMSWADQRAKKMYDCLKYSPVGREKAITEFRCYIPQFKS